MSLTIPFEGWGGIRLYTCVRYIAGLVLTVFRGRPGPHPRVHL